MSQIDLTWNLFATPIVVSISTAVITYVMHRKEKARDTKEVKREAEKIVAKEKIAKLLAEKELMKEKELMEWRNRYDGNVSKITSRLDLIKRCLETKADHTDNKKEHEEFYSWRNDHENRLNIVETQIKKAR